MHKLSDNFMRIIRKYNLHINIFKTIFNTELLLIGFIFCFYLIHNNKNTMI